MRKVPRPIRVAFLAALLAGCGGQVVGVLTFAKIESGTVSVQPLFVDVTPLSGVDLVSVSRLDIVGYGQAAAVADYDLDGDLDVFLTQDVGPCRLYRNVGSMEFGDVAAFAGVQVSAGEAHAKAAAAFDYDRDGDPDLFVGTCGEGNRLFRNLGDGTFEDVSAASGIGGGTDFTLSAHPGDYDGDGLLDLYEVNCVPTDYATPNQHSGLPARNRLWRNQGDGTFADMAPLLGVDDPLAAWAAQWIDLDGDGDQDLLLANDAFFYPGEDVKDRAYINSGAAGGFLFEDRAADYGLDVRHSGMGYAAGDLDGDGLLDLFTTDLGPSELRLGSDPIPWPDRAPALGVEIGFDEEMRHQVTWGTSILDWNGDGWNDLLAFNGVLTPVDPGPQFANRQKPRLFLSRKATAETPADAQANGRVFENVAAAAGLEALGCLGARAGIPADLDRDGDFDLVIPTRIGPAKIVRNDTPASRPWYGVRLKGGASPLEGWGSILELTVGKRTWRQWANSGGQPGSILVPEWRFTPGVQGRAKLTVRWPSGTVQTVTPVRNGWTEVEETP